MARALAHAPASARESATAMPATSRRSPLRTAERLGLPADAVVRTRLGGWLHDVGKAAIPRRILDKPGPLDAAEWDVMRTHPAVGEGVVQGVTSLRDAAAAVRHHHERYDGTGYPDRLAGEAIPIEARIVGAADAYAAMTDERVYSSPIDHDAAVAELERCAGTRFDPQVVSALAAEMRDARDQAPLLTLVEDLPSPTGRGRLGGRPRLSEASWPGPALLTEPRRNVMAIDTLMAYVGVYDSVEDAEADYQLVKDLHTEADLIDAYDAAVVERRDAARPRSSRSTRRRRASAACSAAGSGWPPASSSRCSRSPPSAAGCSRHRRGRRDPRRGRRPRGGRA